MGQFCPMTAAVENVFADVFRVDDSSYTLTRAKWTHADGILISPFSQESDVVL